MTKLNRINIKNRIISLRKQFSSKPDFECTHKTRVEDVPTNTYLAYNKPLDVYHACKKSCIAALQESTPREKVFILDASNRIVGEFNGNATNCNIIIPQVSNLRLLHGHPLQKAGKTLPVSLQDFLILNNKPQLIEIVAFDINGNESRLIKNANYQMLSANDFAELEQEYTKYLLNGATNEMKDKILSLMQYFKNHSKASAIKQSIADLLTQLQYEENSVDSINKFWLDYAKKINLKYIPYQT